MSMSPYQLHIMLDIYCGTPPVAASLAAIYDETMAGLLTEGFVTRDPVPGRSTDLEYWPTPKLDCLIQHILTLPAPVWVMP